jgi:hypothetical protein
MKIGLSVDVRLVLVQVLDERDDAAVVLEFVALAVALVVDRDDDAAVEKGEFAQPLGERVETVFRRFEDLQIGAESHLRAAALRRAGDFEIADRVAALVSLC